MLDTPVHKLIKERLCQGLISNGVLKGTRRTATPSHLTFLQEYAENGGSLKSWSMSFLMHMVWQIPCRSLLQSSYAFVKSPPQSVLSHTTYQSFQTFVRLFLNAPHVFLLSKSFISTLPIFATDAVDGELQRYHNLDLNTVHSETDTQRRTFNIELTK